ncbi:hypothetical protein PCANC_08173 [Puccinia coronata f. sp. avenae]|uniref:Uncharacterized protein n=1 Tax=Puccinia coronata f. sp. avenae TaxID=200324 RepID=A0A2N5VJG7_9BASI|nr:hypothetical protein PCANC_08173 [Puccinia coronata f. sp. avenae]
MPSHLRNGKDLLFEQQRAAKRAAEQALQLPQRADERHGTISSPSVFGHPHSLEPARAATDQLQSSAELHRVAGHTSAAEPPNTIGDSILNKQVVAVSHPTAPQTTEPSGYTFSPSALERLRRAREQLLDQVDRSQGDRLAPDGTLLPPRPQDQPGRAAIAGNVSGLRVQQTRVGSLLREETGFRRHEERSPSSVDGWVYNADTDSPLSPHERSSQGKRIVGGYKLPAPVAAPCGRGGKQHTDRVGSGDLDSRYAIESSRDPSYCDGGIQSLDGQTGPSTLATFHATERAVSNEDPLAHGNNDHSLTQVPGAYGFPRPSCISGASTAIPASFAAAVPGAYGSPRLSCFLGTSTAIPVSFAAAASTSAATISSRADVSDPCPLADSTQYWTPARDLATRRSEVPPSPEVSQKGGTLQSSRPLRVAAASTPLYAPLHNLSTKWKPVQNPLPEALEKPKCSTSGTKEVAKTGATEKPQAIFTKFSV